ncbi:MAG: hypothetical protein LBU35_00075 [Holosporales bacterium]|jgi:hypoxanthine phosphoribosyltransferase|nr:hypothetical protein [Holosporales bacterium]
MRLVSYLIVSLTFYLCACETYKAVDNVPILAASSQVSNDLRIEKVNTIRKKLKETYSARQIEDAINRIASKMNEKFKNDNPIVVCVLKGSVPFTGQLLTKLSFNAEFDCLRVSSYSGEGQRQELKWSLKPSANCVGRSVILVDDCIDSGITLATIAKFYKALGAKEVYTVVLVDKIGVRHPKGLPHTDFVGFSVPGDAFLIGFGLDYEGYLRNLPAIYSVKN